MPLYQKIPNPLTVPLGGTGANTASGARTNLGLDIGIDIQAQDDTLQALANTDWNFNTLPIGDGVDTVGQVSFGANTFPARASGGGLVAQNISDFGLSLVDDASDSNARTTLGLGTIATQNSNNVAITGGSITGLTSLSLSSGAVSAGLVGAPTITNVTNVAASTIQDQQWLRVGNVVTVSGRCTIDPTSASVATEVGISLPIASTTSLFTYVSGTACSSDSVSLSAGCVADITNNRMAIRFINTTDVVSRTWHYTFTYRIV